MNDKILDVSKLELSPTDTLILRVSENISVDAIKGVIEQFLPLIETSQVANIFILKDSVNVETLSSINNSDKVAVFTITSENVDVEQVIEAGEEFVNKNGFKDFVVFPYGQTFETVTEEQMKRMGWCRCREKMN